MLANLPAKRACRQIFPNISQQKRTRKFATNAIVRGRKQILIKQAANGKSTRSFKYVTTSTTTVAAISKNIQLRKQQQQQQILNKQSKLSQTSVRHTRSSPQKPDDIADVNTENSENIVATADAKPIANTVNKREMFIKAIKRKTRRVVSKITNTFRRPLHKRILRNRVLSTVDKVSDGKRKEMPQLDKNVCRRSLNFRKAKPQRNDKDTKCSESKGEISVNLASILPPEQDLPAAEPVLPTAPTKKKIGAIKAILKGIKNKCDPKLKTTQNIAKENVIADSAINTDTQNLMDNKPLDLTCKKKQLVKEPMVSKLASSELIDAKPNTENSKIDQPQVMQQPEITVKIPTENTPTALSTVIENIPSDNSLNTTINIITSPNTNSSLTSKNDIKSTQNETPLATPSLQTTSPQVRRRTRKLNDCIAMLTGKLQEKLGVPFLENNCTLLLPPKPLIEPIDIGKNNQEVEANKTRIEELPIKSNECVDAETSVIAEPPMDIEIASLTHPAFAAPISNEVLIIPELAMNANTSFSDVLPRTRKGRKQKNRDAPIMGIEMKQTELEPLKSISSDGCPETAIAKEQLSKPEEETEQNNGVNVDSQIEVDNSEKPPVDNELKPLPPQEEIIENTSETVIPVPPANNPPIENCDSNVALKENIKPPITDLDTEPVETEKSEKTDQLINIDTASISKTIDLVEPLSVDRKTRSQLTLEKINAVIDKEELVVPSRAKSSSVKKTSISKIEAPTPVKDAPVEAAILNDTETIVQGVIVSKTKISTPSKGQAKGMQTRKKISKTLSDPDKEDNVIGENAVADKIELLENAIANTSVAITQKVTVDLHVMNEKQECAPETTSIKPNKDDTIQKSAEATPLKKKDSIQSLTETNMASNEKQTLSTSKIDAISTATDAAPVKKKKTIKFLIDNQNNKKDNKSSTSRNTQRKHMCLVNGIEMTSSPQVVVVDCLKNVNAKHIVGSVNKIEKSTSADPTIANNQLETALENKVTPAEKTDKSSTTTCSTGDNKKNKAPTAKLPAAKSPAAKAPAVKSSPAKSPAVKSPAVKSPETIFQDDAQAVKKASSVLESSDEEFLPWDPEVGFIAQKPIIESGTQLVEKSEGVISEPIDQNVQVKPASKQRKRRKNELAKIIADQLLESFKEVDQSRIEELKILHDLSIESNDDLLLSSSMSNTPTPKRRTATKMANDALTDLVTSFDDSSTSGDGNATAKTKTRKKINVDSGKLPKCKVQTPNNNEPVVAAPRATSNSRCKKKIVKTTSLPELNKKNITSFKSSVDIESGHLSDTEIVQPKAGAITARRKTLCSELSINLVDVISEKEKSRKKGDIKLKPLQTEDIDHELVADKSTTRVPTPKFRLVEGKKGDTKFNKITSIPPVKNIKRGKSAIDNLVNNILSKKLADDTSEPAATVENIPKKIRNSRRSIDTAVSSLSPKGKKNVTTNIASESITKSPTKTKSSVNDLVAQIINDFTTSTIDSRNNSPLVFVDLPKLNAAASTISPVPNTLNTDAATKTVMLEPKSKPKLKSLEAIKRLDDSHNLKSPMRAPFMSPRWELSLDDKSSSTKSNRPEQALQTPLLPSLWHKNTNSSIKLAASNKINDDNPTKMSVFQNAREKTKKLLSKIAKRKSKKSELFPSKKRTTPLPVTSTTLKRPLLRPSILTGSINCGNADAIDNELCLRKLESNSLFVGRDKNFEQESMSNIFISEKTNEISKKSDLNIFNEVDSIVSKVGDIKNTPIKQGKGRGKNSKGAADINKQFDDLKAAPQETQSILSNHSPDHQPTTDVQIAASGSTANTSVPVAEPPIIKLVEICATGQPSDVITQESSQETSMLAENVVNDNINTKKPNSEVKNANISPIKRRKLGSHKQRRKRNMVQTSPKVYAAGTSETSVNLNTAFICSESPSAATKSVVVEQSKSLPPNVEESINMTNYDNSQDTILSGIVNKIRDDVNEQTESDEDLCLAEIAKSLNNKLFHSDEFSNDANSPPVELSESYVANNNFSDLINTLNSNLEIKKVSAENTDTKAADSSNSHKPDIFDIDDNTNTELVDMDLEDNMSVYTSFSMDTSITNAGKNGMKKKRRHRKSILLKSSRKVKKQEDLFLLPTESNFCTICSKSFRSLAGLATHKTTLTHISKLSEQEFLKSKMDEPVAETSPSVSHAAQPKVPEDEKNSVIDEIDETSIQTAEQVVLRTSEKHFPLIQPTSPIASLIPDEQTTACLQQTGIEPISSPEQNDYSVDMFNVKSRSTLPTTESTIGDSRLALSQEERLFYECCSMLKGSDRPSNESPPKYYPLGGITSADMLTTKPVTPKSNEQYSYVVPEGSKLAKSIPKIDLNQFSDISSDSNPAYSCPQVPSSSEAHRVFSKEQTTTGDSLFLNSYTSSAIRAFSTSVTSTAGTIPLVMATTISSKTATIITSKTSFNSNVNDNFSDMSEHFPSSHGTSGSDNYVPSMPERTNVYSSSNYLAPTLSKKTCNGTGRNKNPAICESTLISCGPDGDVSKAYLDRSPIDSPMHSTSSQSSTISKPRTKAAMKGYENFKVSIPTTGIDLQQALNRSPNSAGCKLAALADIALGNDVPHAVGLIPSICSDVEPSKTGFIEEPATVSRSPLPKKLAPLGNPPKISTNIRKKVSSTGNKLGFKQRKKKVNEKIQIGKLSKSTTNKTHIQKPKDVYDFEDSRDSIDDPILPLLSQTKVTKPVKDKSPIDQPEESQLSSYSDRDDYNYEDSLSDSESSGLESHASSSVTKRSEKSTNNLQKKCLIMGRIFKSVKKADPIPKKSSKVNEIKELKKPIPKQELDKMFDSLRGATSATNSKQAPEAASEKSVNDKNKKSAKTSAYADKEKKSKQRSGARQSRKPREISNLEAEWGMSMDKIIDLMGVGQRKTQRRCAANKQKTFAETWSSDEYEEFHSTKDIIALIQEVELKASRSARNAKRNGDASKADAKLELTHDDKAVNDEMKNQNKPAAVVDQEATKNTCSLETDKENRETEQDIKKIKDVSNVELPASVNEPAAAGNSKSKRKAQPKSDDTPAKCKKSTSFVGVADSDDDTDIESEWSKRTVQRSKIKNRRRTIAFKEDDESIKLKTKQLPTSKAKTPATTPYTSVNTQKPTQKMEPKPMARRKRIASEMLYYWSSSSDEEFGRIKPRENYNDDNLEQHGWIVGDSHKKLVTLLAHAKGKKIEDCGVKEAIHKKKSSN